MVPSLSSQFGVQLLNASTDFIVLLNDDFVVTFENKTAVLCNGRSVKDLPLSELTLFDCETLKQIFQQTRLSPNSFQEFEVKYAFYSKDKFSILVGGSAAYYEDAHTFFLIIKNPEVEKERKKKEWMEELESINGARGFIIEFFEEERDNLILHRTKGASVPEEGLGKFAIKDLGFPREDVEKFTEIWKSLSPGEEITVNNHHFRDPFLPWYDQFHSIHIKYLERSTQGRPIIATLGFNIKQTRLMQEFLSASPALFGIVRLIQTGEEKDILHLFANPNARAFFHDSLINRRLFQDAGKSKEKVGQLLRGFQESRKAGLPIPFDMMGEEDAKEMAFCSGFAFKLDDDLYAYVAQDSTKIVHLQRSLKEKSQQLQEALTIKSRFLATVSHEIRTPLSGVVGMLGLLSSGQLSQEQRENLNFALTCSEQLLVVISDILDLTKLEEKSFILEMKKMNLCKTLEESVGIACLQADAKGIDIIMDVDTSIGEVIGDPVRINQIVLNLLNNAIKFSTENKTVLLRVETTASDEPEVKIFKISVKDEGCGISQSHQTRLFEPFHQVDNSVSRRKGGSGLGLTLSKRFVELMGGKIGLESEENIGSTFWFEIPLKLVGSAPRSPLTEQIHQPKEISIISNRILFQDCLQRVLRSMRFRVSIGRFSPDCYLTIVDSKCDSKEVLELLRNNSVRLDKALVVGKSSNEWKGISAFDKPLTPTSLKSIFESLQTTDSPPIPQPAPKLSVSQSVRILVAEDNLMNQKLIEKQLKMMGNNNFKIVDNGKKAVEEVEKEKYDVILMDLMMPYMGGLEATIEIRKRKIHQPLIIALTANAFQEVKEECMSGGMNEVLTKPVKLDQLVAVLNQLITGRQLEPM